MIVYNNVMSLIDMNIYLDMRLLLAANVDLCTDLFTGQCNEV